MRIAMISEHASPLAVLGEEDAGGQNTHVAELAAALVGEGHDVRVYTRRDSVDLPDVVDAAAGYQVRHVPAGPAQRVPKDELLPYMGEFGRWMAEQWGEQGWRPDVAHAHFWMSGLATLHAGRRTNTPVVLTYHALGSVKRRHQGARDTSPPGRVGYERALGRAADRVIVQCQDEIGELVRLGVPRSRMALVPSGVNEEMFRPEGPVAPRDPARPRILTVGRMVERKGFQDVIRALPAVPEAECVVVGGPAAELLPADSFARRLGALAESCGVADRVKLVGAVPREEMGAWYRSADVLVAAPWYEPFGLTPLEGMACGVPVIGTNVGGIADTVVDGLTGDLVPPRDPRALGTAIRRLLADRVRRFAYATAALDRIRSRYSWKRCAEQLSAVYTTVSTVSRVAPAVA
ncbi:Glycosyltransferase involved in cell wall bisynthesis [Micromonospora purpureochromogenes]|uniref:Glycosyltransferase involved in cell wall bisynthesis n=1 Tax=Micromonospora purpureochromogenes TaxID=47872 RepID=A0A1C4ZLZ8_9ACTN|nr:glycosyltransferase [Micromonospora purpureochromogenes]SCF33952.1 Glycosyltransferase involved in cell wall bisynthesis [Micromonospora purpureochromogenes]